MKFSKFGFGVPIDYWLRNELKDELLKLIDKDFLNKQGLFNYELLQDMFDKHLKKAVNYNAQLWNIFVFQKWYLNNIKTDLLYKSYGHGLNHNIRVALFSLIL